MNILIVTEYYFPHIGGVEIVFKNLAERLTKMGHNVKVVTSRVEGTLKFEVINGVEVYRSWVPKFADRYFFTFFSLPKIQKFAKWADVIHTTLYNAAVPAWIAAKIYNKPAVITAHEVYGDRWHELFEMNKASAALHKMLERAILKLHFDQYVSVSESTRRDLAKHKDDKKITTIYNGIDYDFFDRERHLAASKKVKDGESIKGGSMTKAGQSPKTYNILFYGRPGISKGVEYLIKSMKAVFAKIPEARLKLILSKKPANGYKRVMKMIKALDKTERARIEVADPVGYTELPAHILAADLVVIPSLAEGFGFTAAESSALKMTMVASKAGSLPEVASGKVVFCEPKSAKSIADSIFKAYKGEFENASEKKFCWDENAGKHFTVYKMAIDGRGVFGDEGLRVAVVMDGWNPVLGGAQVHLEETVRIFTKKYGCEIDLFTRKLKDEKGRRFCKNEVGFGGKFRIYRSGFCADFFNLFSRIFWLVRPAASIIYKHYFRGKYDLIHAHAFLPAIPAKIAKFFIRRPLVYTVHGTSIGIKEEFLTQSVFFRRIERYLVCGIKYDKEITVAENFLEFENVNKDIQVIANGVNTSDFDRIDVKKNKDFTILYVGRFDKIKGVDYLIKAFATIEKQSKMPIKLDLVGYGYEEKSLKELVSKMELGRKVHFLGKKTGDELIKIYKKSHLFVLPSLSEGQPLTLLEAFAAKLPVVATKVGDNEKYIQDGNNGFLAKPGDADDLVKMIGQVIGGANDVKEIKNLTLGENGYKLVKKNLTWQITAEKVINVWKSVIKK